MTDDDPPISNFTILGHHLDDLPTWIAVPLFVIMLSAAILAMFVPSTLFALELLAISGIAALLLFANSVPGGIK